MTHYSKQPIKELANKTVRLVSTSTISDGEIADINTKRLNASLAGFAQHKPDYINISQQHSRIMH